MMHGFDYEGLSIQCKKDVIDHPLFGVVQHVK